MVVPWSSGGPLMVLQWSSDGPLMDAPKHESDTLWAQCWVEVEGPLTPILGCHKRQRHSMSHTWLTSDHTI